MIPQTFAIVQYQTVGTSESAKPFNDAEKGNAVHLSRYMCELDNTNSRQLACCVLDQSSQSYHQDRCEAWTHRMSLAVCASAHLLDIKSSLLIRSTISPSPIGCRLATPMLVTEALAELLPPLSFTV